MREEYKISEEYQRGIDLFTMAGYTVKINFPTFGLFKGDDKIRGYSTITFLRPQQVIKEIQDISLHNGFNRGIKSNQEKIKILLGLK